MELDDLEIELLKVLAAEWDENGPPGYLETKILAQRLDISVWKTKSTIDSLYVRGLVDRDEIDKFAAYLTPEGYEKVRT